MADKKRTFFGGAAVLMVGSIIVKIIGACYKIPLVNVLGDVGYGHFMVAYTIFNVIMTIAVAGLPVAISKFIAEADALGRRNQVKKIFRVSLITLVSLGMVGFLVMLLGAGPLAAWQGDTGARYAIMALSPCVLFLCTVTAFRGYAQGHGNMTPTSVSQVVEALLKLILGLAFTVYIMGLTFQTEAEKLEMGAAGAILGVTLGSLASLICLLFWYSRSGRQDVAGGTDTADTSRSILSRLLRIAVPITIGSSAVAIVSLIDTNQVLNILQDKLGWTEEVATGLYGTYQGCLNLYNLPSALMVPFTASVIPAVSAARARRNGLEARKVAESALRISALIALPMGIGLCVLGSPIISLLYPKLDVAVAGPSMSILGVASIFVCVMLLCNSILQANGFVNLPIITTVIGGLVKLVCNIFLVGNPDINVQGAAISTLACFVVTAVLDVFIILRVVPSPPNFLRAFGKPLAASLIMGAGAWAVCGLTSNFLGPRIGCVAGILAGGLIYLFLVIFLRVFSKDDLELMPKGDKIARILKIK